MVQVFEVDPNTVLHWLAAADQLKAFSEYFLHDMRVTQVQLDELFALLRAVKTGEVSEAEAVERLSEPNREAMTGWFTPGGRLVTGLSHLSVPGRYTTLSGLRWAIEQCFETSRAALLRVDCRVNVYG